MVVCSDQLSLQQITTCSQIQMFEGSLMILIFSVRDDSLGSTLADDVSLNNQNRQDLSLVV
jgi:hypothetical protein